MAALSEEDLVKILGPNYREIEKASHKRDGIEAEEREVNKMIDSAEEKKVPAGGAVCVGIVLMISAFYTAVGREYWITSAAGALIMLTGAVLLVYLYRRLVTLRAQSATLHAATAARAA